MSNHHYLDKVTFIPIKIHKFQS